MTDNEPIPGLLALRVLRANAIGNGDRVQTIAFAEEKRFWPNHAKVMAHVTKAAVPTITSMNAPLFSEVGADLMNAIRPLTVIGRLGVRRLPLRTRMLTSNVGAVAGWLGEGHSAPLRLGAFTAQSLDERKIVVLMVASDELLRSDLVDVERGLLDDMLSACRQVLDMTFLDPTNAGVAGERPASIAHPSQGGILIPSTGNTVAAIDTDMKAAVAALLTAGSNLERAKWVFSQGLATKLSMLRGTGGALSHPGLSTVGGLVANLPWIASQSAPANTIQLIDAAHVGVAEQEPELGVSKQGAIDMNGSPGEDRMVTPMSMFQTESSALRAMLRVNFLARKPAAATVTGVTL
ncbi:MAG: phage major capsid protein [Pseudorhodoferax sp.]